MHARHVAYGLSLQASFPLVGMPSRSAEGLPALALELLASAELEDLWSGPVGRPEWTGRLGDGCTLTIERGVRGDVLFTYGDRARFRLDASHERLGCAPLREGPHWQQALLGRVLPNVAIMRGYEALHASAVCSPEGVVAVAGPSGMGKTTLALELLERGWPLFADDVLTLGDGSEGARAHPEDERTYPKGVQTRPEDKRTYPKGTRAHPEDVRAYPGSPHMNVAEGPPGAADPELLGTTLGILAGERWIAVHRTAAEPRPVRLVCLLERTGGLPLESRVLPSNPLPLAPYMLGLPGDAERERRRFARFADLMSSASLMRLTCGSADRPAALADSIERALAQQPLLAAGSAR